jgi:multidrug efflux pump subunit AcrA (membrane-fusion protein)
LTNLPSNALNAQLLLLSALLQLEKEARHADSLTALGFLMVNDSHRLVNYDHALLWRFNRVGRIKIEAASGASFTDDNAPFVRWAMALSKELLQDRANAASIHQVEVDKLSPRVAKEWQERAHGDALWCPFIDPKHGVRAGLILFRREPAWRDSELTLLERLTDAYAHAWAALGGYAGFGVRHKKHPLRRLLVVVVLAALVALSFVPVHESVLVPGEVIAARPIVVSAPISGTIAAIQVQPNQSVNVGDPLFNLNDTEERNRYLIAQESLAVAEAELLSAEQKAFQSRESKSEVSLLRAKVREQQAEVNYLKDVLERMQVRAERDGIAVFTDPNDWLGKPVSVGEKIMSLADPAQTEIQLNVPVADAISLSEGARVLLFLNTDPTRPHEAQLYQAAYEAEPTPDQRLVFRAKARFQNSDNLPRIGLKGTGKIYGKQVKLYYYLFRRPVAALRQWFGL